MTRNQYRQIADTIRTTKPISIAAPQAHKQFADTFTAIARYFEATDPKFPRSLFLTTCMDASVQWGRR